MIYEPQDRLHSLLLLSGMVKLRQDGTERRLIARNRIFREVFGSKWIQERDRSTPDWLTDKLFAYWETDEAQTTLCRGSRSRERWIRFPKRSVLPPDLAEFIGRSQQVRDREERRQRTILHSRWWDSFRCFRSLRIRPIGGFWTKRCRSKSCGARFPDQAAPRISFYAEQQIAKLTARIESLEEKSGNFTVRCVMQVSSFCAKKRAASCAYRNMKPSCVCVIFDEKSEVERRLRHREQEKECRGARKSGTRKVRLRIDERLRALEPSPSLRVGPPLAKKRYSFAMVTELAGKIGHLSQPESLKLRQAVGHMGTPAAPISARFGTRTASPDAVSVCSQRGREAVSAGGIAEGFRCGMDKGSRCLRNFHFRTKPWCIPWRPNIAVAR